MVGERTSWGSYGSFEQVPARAKAKHRNLVPARRPVVAEAAHVEVGSHQNFTMKWIRTYRKPIESVVGISNTNNAASAIALVRITFLLCML